LLNGLTPDAVWVGEGDRLHYLGTDMILDAAAQQRQRPLFPSERYAEGFSAPEVLVEGNLGPAADLYSWAALGYFLLTADVPAANARFADSHFDRLAHALQVVGSAELQRVQRAFRIAGSRFVHTWPDSFVSVVRECLAEEPDRRPASCAALVQL